MSDAGAPAARVHVFPSPDELALGAAERVTAIVEAAIEERGRCSIALAGGSTPRPLYRLLASRRFSDRIRWQELHVFWGDERCVPPEDPASNYGMAQEALLHEVPVAAAHVHRIHGEQPPEAAADAYEIDLREHFEAPAGANRMAQFDLVLLGLGSNGHTASLFPGQRAVHERERWVLAERIAELAAWRITLTPPVINAAREVLFLVSGSAKAEVVRRVLEEQPQPDRLPAQAIQPSGGAVWFLDAAAASQLGRRA
jgi:6-phosphogluconolactonase